MRLLLLDLHLAPLANAKTRLNQRKESWHRDCGDLYKYRSPERPCKAPDSYYAMGDESRNLAYESLIEHKEFRYNEWAVGVDRCLTWQLSLENSSPLRPLDPTPGGGTGA